MADPVGTKTPAPEPVAEPVKQEIKYELKMPEGSKDDTLAKEIMADAKELGLSNEAAQKMLDIQIQRIAQFTKANEDNAKRTIQGWNKSMAEDKDFGGSNLAKTNEDARRSSTRFFTQDELKQIGAYAQHPILVKAFARIGAAMREDKIIGGGSASNQSVPPAERMYPKNKA